MYFLCKSCHHAGEYPSMPTTCPQCGSRLLDSAAPPAAKSDSSASHPKDALGKLGIVFAIGALVSLFGFLYILVSGIDSPSKNAESPKSPSSNSDTNNTPDAVKNEKGAI